MACVEGNLGTLLVLVSIQQILNFCTAWGDIDGDEHCWAQVPKMMGVLINPPPPQKEKSLPFK